MKNNNTSHNITEAYLWWDTLDDIWKKELIFHIKGGYPKQKIEQPNTNELLKILNLQELDLGCKKITDITPLNIPK